ncbi:hypothetical protein FIBSPDRAFT_965931 [Athelia psychrophila]|uniref:Uncharacterized protein n=1 Tax=Athelia psychrophila TaxID=1759441 RepID=A0A167XBX1_9AGAM|nr:hypothetical protein FIBSPDRAFT_965931 [Fibularhizoctonia sp. CBS 109695]
MSSHHTSQNHLHDSAMYNIAGGMYDMRDIIVINNYHISYSAAAVRLDGSDESNHAQAAPSTIQDHEPDGLQSSGSLADGATESAVLLEELEMYTEHQTGGPEATDTASEDSDGCSLMPDSGAHGGGMAQATETCYPPICVCALAVEEDVMYQRLPFGCGGGAGP